MPKIRIPLSSKTPADLDKSLEKITATDVETQAPSDLEEQSFAERRADAEIQQANAETEDFRQNTGLRKTYAHRIFCLISAWLITVFLLLIFQGMGIVYVQPFRLSDNLMLAVVGSTTVNVLGIFYIVTNYLFPKK